MTELFKNKYRIQTTRAPWRDYRDNGAYFITICTSIREHYFGKIMQGEMQLSNIGRQAVHCWMKIPEHFPFVKLDAFVVMPNHIHGIIIIDKSELTDKSSNAMGDNAMGGNAMGDNAIVETQYIASLQKQQQQQRQQQRQQQQRQQQRQQYYRPQTKSKNKFGPQSNNLASIIRGVKIGVTLHCNKNKILFGWQPRFHDHIIRNDDELNRIRGYINNNPANWVDDEHYSL